MELDEKLEERKRGNAPFLAAFEHVRSMLSLTKGKMCELLNVKASRLSEWDKGVNPVPQPVKYALIQISVEKDIGQISIDYLDGYTDIMLLDNIPADELAEIEKLKAEKYDTWDWNFGRSPKFQRNCKKRFAGGMLELHLDVADGCIGDIRILGDFLALTPVDPLADALKGCPYREDAVAEVLDKFCLQDILGGIEKTEFLETLFA
jgi:lipoate-protein ligase A